MTDDIAREHREGNRDISIWRQRAEAAELDVERLTAALDVAETTIEEIQKVGHQDDAGVEQALADYDAAKEALNNE